METKIAARPVVPPPRPMPRDAGFPVPGVSDGVPADALPLGLPVEAVGAGAGGAVGSIVADDKIRGLLQGLGVGAGAIGGGRLTLPEDGDPDLKTLLGVLAGGGLGYVGGGLAADLAGHGRRRGVLADEEEKFAEAHPALARLLLAKSYSDRKEYLRKHAVLRGLLTEAPNDFFIDSRADTGILGLTHRPTHFQIHMPSHMMPAGVSLAEEIPDPLEKAANRLLSLVKGVAAPAAAPAAAAGRALGTAATTVARAVPAAGRAVVNRTLPVVRGAAREMGGYAPKGPLAGQRPFDASTVKPRLTPTQYRERVAGGATRDQLAATHQLPAWWHRLPGGTAVGQLGNRMNRHPVLHPVVQAANTVNNVMSTPITAPFTRPLARTLATRGAANAAGGRPVRAGVQRAGAAALTGFDKAIGPVAGAASNVALGVGAYRGLRAMSTAPPGQPTLATDPVPVARAVINESVHNPDPTRQALSNVRDLTPAGYVGSQLMRSLADPPPAPPPDPIGGSQ